MDISNPVLCGGGPEEERAYLDRLRCPAGEKVTYSRRGSIAPTTSEFRTRDGVNWYPGENPLLRAMDGKDGPDKPLDIFDVTCGCGQHTATVYMDMYHRGNDDATRVIGLPGWTLR